MGTDLFAVTARVFYKKQGRAKYISHLDLVRCISRALKRSKLPVWHTLGFHPHVYLTFALPLALGYESECESMDFRLTETLPMEAVVDRLNAVLPEGICCHAAAPAVMKPDAIKWADYTVTQEFDSVDAGEAWRAFAGWCARETVPVVKKGKKGERVVDVKPHFTLGEPHAEGDTLTFSIRAAAGSAFNLNPTLLLDTFAQEGGARAGWVRVVRTAVLDGNLRPFE
ncbi:TIGR03936 family radical SAM-associated protein [Anaerotruncus colihominis]|uniref:TIGR03936 family radical SAM-associated protein n=1 Tax=Anaerotruncus colihominis TaxID=169435 RepID=UPI001899C712|nr:TIGR03936 family radical SAM-associated protein [Anaerotruncus colihominis]